MRRAKGSLSVPPLVVAWLGCSAAAAEEDAAPRQFLFESELGGRVGASAGHALLTPFAFALPGGGLSVKLRWHTSERVFLEGRAALSLGVDESGTLGGGYRAQLGLGTTWLDVGWAWSSSRVVGGLSSFSLIPVPSLGTATKLTVAPLDLEWLLWTIELEGAGEVLLLVPRVALGASTGLFLTLFDVTLGLEAGAFGELLVAYAANVASASAGVSLLVAYRW